MEGVGPGETKESEPLQPHLSPVDSHSHMVPIGAGEDAKDRKVSQRNNHHHEEEHDERPTRGENIFDDAFQVEFEESEWISIGGLSISLSTATILMAILGAIVGGLIAEYRPPDSNWQLILQCPGRLWVNGLKLLVLPLISLMMLILPSRISNAASKSRYAISFYIFTSTIAACEGLIWGNIIRPGSHGGNVQQAGTALQNSVASAGSISELESFLGIFYQAVPSNIIVAMSSLNILGILCFFYAMGYYLRFVIRRQRETIIDVASGLLKCVMMGVVTFIKFTPFGMFFLVLHRVSSTPDLVGLLRSLGFYLLTAVIGHSIHLFIFYPLLYFLVTKQNGWKHWITIHRAPLTAFATSSSAATLPVSMEVAEKAKVTDDTRSFIIPLGAAINMDGTSLGFPIMILFISQLINYEMNAGTQIVIGLLSIVCSIGTAPIPNAGMLYLLMLMSAAGGPLAIPTVQEDALATLFVLDWFIDRIETASNVTSDQFVAKMVDYLDTSHRDS